MNASDPLPGIAFLDVEDGCKWPISGDGLDLRVCGARTANGKSYCTPHRLLAYVPMDKDAPSLLPLRPRLSGESFVGRCGANSFSQREKVPRRGG